jgi:hypothetical protein
LHSAIIIEQVQQGIPFFIQQQEHIAPGIIAHRFCIIDTAIMSSLVHIIFIPPSHFSIIMVQRGIIIPDIMPIPGIIPGICIPDIMLGIATIPVFSIIIVDIVISLSKTANRRFFVWLTGRSVGDTADKIKVFDRFFAIFCII